MINSSYLFEQTQLAEAAYSSFLKTNGGLFEKRNDFKKGLTDEGFSESQADEFLKHWRVVSQYATGGTQGDAGNSQNDAGNTQGGTGNSQNGTGGAQNGSGNAQGGTGNTQDDPDPFWTWDGSGFSATLLESIDRPGLI